MNGPTDLATWTPAIVAVGIVVAVLGVIALMAYSVASRLTALDERILNEEASHRSKKRHSGREKQRRADEMRDRRDRIRGYRRTAGVLLVAAAGMVCLNVAMASMVLLPLAATFVIVVASIGGLVILAKKATAEPRFEGGGAGGEKR